MEKVIGLLDKLRELREIEKRKKEVKERFKEVFGIEPEIVTVDKAKSEITETSVIRIAEQLLFDLGYNPAWVSIILICKRVLSEELRNKNTDWQLDEYGLGLHKYESGFVYMMRIDWEDERDC